MTRVVRAACLTTLLLLVACSSAPIDAWRSGRPVSVRPSDGEGPATVGTYAIGPGVRVHAWFVSGRAAAPWVVYIHGGSWYAGRGNSAGGIAWAGHEIARGYQVFALDYRLSSAAKWPAQREDVAEGVEWIRARAQQFGIDVARAAILGESAGGQLAAIEASRGRFDGVVDLAGVVDPLAVLKARDADLASAAMRLVGCSVAMCPRLWQDTRAIMHVGPLTPPFLIVHSIADPVVPSSMSRAFGAALRAAGIPVTLRIVAGRAHGILQLPDVRSQVDEFIDGVTR